MQDETKIPRRCAHCEYWDSHEVEQRIGEEEIGTCHLKPPEIVVQQGQAIALHPHTAALDWCGEWKLRVDA